MTSALTKGRIIELFTSLNTKLEKSAVIGELYLVGGAVMCLVLESRPATMDVDAYFVPQERVRQAAREIADEQGLSVNWLNDAVKGFFGKEGGFTQYLDLPNLKVFVAVPEYLLAMKCLSMRLGPEFHDEADVRYLLRYLNVESCDQALAIVAKYYPLDRMPRKTLNALHELLPGV